MKFISRKNIAFFGTGGIFSNIVLRNLHEMGIPINIVFILVKPNSNLHPLNEKFCVQNDINYKIIENTNTNFVRETLNELKIDLGVIASYSQILKDEIICSTHDGFINLHPSYLPYYKGANPFFWQIKDGKDVFGATVHKVTNEVDEGLILIRDQWMLGNLLSADEILQTVASRGSDLLGKIILQYQNYDKLIPEEIVPIQEVKKGFYNPKPAEKDFEVNLLEFPPDKLLVLMNRVKKWGELYFFYNNQKFIITNVNIHNNSPNIASNVKKVKNFISVFNKYGTFTVETKE